MEDILFKAENISKNFPSVKALKSVNFSLAKGEIHCLLGENGAGKSTFIKTIAGVYGNHYEGELYIEGVKTDLINPVHAFHCGIAAIHQHRDLVPTMSAVENIFLGIEIENNGFVNFSTQYEKSRDVISRFDANMNLTCPISELTIAEQEIIAICRALMRDCEILLIDEATAPLDSNERKILFKILRELKDKDKKGIIFITHNLEEVLEIGDNVTVFKDGELVGTRRVKEVSVNDIITMMIGEKTRKHYQKGQIEKKEELLKLENVSVDNRIQNISFFLKKGEILGIAGKLGSYKEQIADVIFGIGSNYSGKILFNRKECKIKSPIHAIRLGIGQVPVDRREEGLVLCRGVTENIILTLINKIRRFICSISENEKQANKYKQLLGIEISGVNQRVEYLSGGNQQKVVLGKWLAADAELLILLEPTEGIDVKTRGDIYNLVEDLARSGRGILIISSDIDELLVISDRILVMREGRIVDDVARENMNKEYILEKAIYTDRMEIS